MTENTLTKSEAPPSTDHRPHELLTTTLKLVDKSSATPPTVYITICTYNRQYQLLHPESATQLPQAQQLQT